MSARAALVVSDRDWSRTLEKSLAAAGLRADVYASVGKFLDSLPGRRPDVLLMDMHLPGVAGREIFRALRSDPETARMILIGLSDRPREKDEVTAAFDAGADEYFFKPVDEPFLLARLQSLMRRAAAPPEEPRYRHFGLDVRPDTRQCLVDGREVRLTRLEFDLLVEFLRNPKRVLTRGGLIGALWSDQSSSGSRAVDRHISALRAKLGSCGALLETLVGVGYRLTSAPRRAASKAVRS